MHRKRVHAEAVPRACAARQQHGMRRRTSSSRHMRVHPVGACRVLKNLMLVAGVHDNDRLQLPYFDNHASLETGATRVRFPLKNYEHGSSMRVRAGTGVRTGSGPDVRVVGTLLGQSSGET